MFQGGTVGQIVILNGTPRSGKSSIATMIQNMFEGVWMNLGVDRFKQMTPQRYQPGIGLRPGGERPDLEPLIVILYRAMYETIALHSRLGLNVVVDVGHHDAYAVPRGILPTCARLLEGLPVLFVGVRCPLEVVMQRRRATWPVSTADDGSVPRSSDTPSGALAWSRASCRASVAATVFCKGKVDQFLLEKFTKKDTDKNRF